MCVFIPSFGSVMFWTCDHEAILYTGLRLHRKLFHCGIGRQEVLLMRQNKGISLFATWKSALHSPGEEKEDYSACMLRKAEQTLLRLLFLLLDTNNFVDFLK